MLDEPDWDIYYWSVKKKEPPARFKNTVLLQRCVRARPLVLHLAGHWLIPLLTDYRSTHVMRARWCG